MLLAVQNGYDANELVKYIDEDLTGGYHVQAALATWPSGSVWESEGQMLYALVRYLKPQHVVEIGCLYGCSSTHIASALLKNGSGRISSVDNAANGKHGDLIPLDRREVIDLVRMDGGVYLESLPDNSVDMIFEDAGHGEEDVYRFTVLAMKKLKPGGLLINHDALHDLAYYNDGNKVAADDGQKIRAGLTRAGANFQTYKPHESDCGFAVTKKEVPGYPMGGTVRTLEWTTSNTNTPTRVKVDSEAIPPEEDARTWSSPLESEAFLEPGVAIDEAGLPANEFSEFKTTEVNLSEDGNSGTFTMEREAPEPPPAKKPRRKRVAKGKS
jgi:predicted O-methyltransferase YrrM